MMQEVVLKIPALRSSPSTVCVNGEAHYDQQGFEYEDGGGTCPATPDGRPRRPPELGCHTTGSDAAPNWPSCVEGYSWVWGGEPEGALGGRADGLGFMMQDTAGPSAEGRGTTATAAVI
ncbi:hypothetical protein SRHO_G00111380 [Serrasalmus rhombeus]